MNTKNTISSSASKNDAGNNQNINYYLEFKKQIDKEMGKKKKLLLHACCAPCSSHCLMLLCGVFSIDVYFYNPNIDEENEYIKRVDELKRFIKEAGLDCGIIDGGYDTERFYEMSRGREMLPERGARCYDCYELRMSKSAEYAYENGYDYFTTTLSISPYKNSKWINEIGMKLEHMMMDSDAYENEHIPAFLFSDFKKESGYAHSIELSKDYSLYRQDYCGCRFSKEERLRKLAERKDD